ncbi:MAG: adenylate/guanylate cyclase domain-containing protein, partial [Leptolyngbyaceae bacterium]|nr:adenylate/guanylate cyclase domain-containing protein [Leptolyngbyaceae bacterium]
IRSGGVVCSPIQTFCRHIPNMKLIKAIAVKKFFSPTRLGYGLIGFWAILGAIATLLEGRVIQLPLPMPTFLGNEISLTVLDGRIPQQWERQVQQTFYKLRGPVAPPKDIVILGIDEESLAQGDFYRANPQRYAFLAPLQSWPWQRSVYAEAVEKLMQAGARSVAIDLIFADPSSYGPEDDQKLQQTLQKYAGKVTLVAQYADSITPQGSSLRLEYPHADLKTTPMSVGFINYLLDIDGRVHQLASEYQTQVIRPSGLPADLPSFDDAALQAAQVPYPSPKGSEIFFYGPRYTFETIPFFHLIDPQNWNGYLRSGQYFKDKIVLIGPTATDLQDFQRTPFSDKLPGIEIHANAIATLMENRAIASLPNPLLNGLLVFVGVMGSGVLLAIIPKQTVARLLGALGFAGIWAGFSYLSFTSGGLILPTAVPMLGMILSGFSYLATGAVSDQLEKLRLRRTLERYVAAPIVKEILNQSEDFQALLQGRKLQVAVLFCDIRGFTTLSSHLPPEQLVGQLNAYLNLMVQSIIAARGTIDKFIGDAIMAEFGSPTSQGEKADALNAIKAALGMRLALVELRRSWKKSGQPLFFNGIGINFGEVIAGNIGSIQRLEYTVIGDAVNVASRVEGLTKELETDILITESLYNLVQTEVEVEDMGIHPLRGRGSSVHLYSVMGWKGEDVTLYHQIRQELRQAQADLKRYLQQSTDQSNQAKPAVSEERLDG